MVAAQDPFPGGQGLLEQRDRVGDPARLPVGGREVTAGIQRAGMVGTQQSLPGGQGQLVQQPRLSGPARVL